MDSALNKSPGFHELAALNKSPDISSAAPALEVPVPSTLTLPIEEIASAMGLAPQSLMRKHKRLTKDHGFPPPLPGGVWRWSRAAFEAWVRANGASGSSEDEPGTAANGCSSRLVIEQNASLRARYGAAR